MPPHDRRLPPYASVLTRTVCTPCRSLRSTWRLRRQLAGPRAAVAPAAVAPAAPVAARGTQARSRCLTIVRAPCWPTAVRPDRARRTAALTRPEPRGGRSLPPLASGRRMCREASAAARPPHGRLLQSKRPPIHIPSRPRAHDQRGRRLRTGHRHRRSRPPADRARPPLAPATRRRRGRRPLRPHTAPHTQPCERRGVPRTARPARRRRRRRRRWHTQRRRWRRGGASAKRSSPSGARQPAGALWPRRWPRRPLTRRRRRGCTCCPRRAWAALCAKASRQGAPPAPARALPRPRPPTLTPAAWTSPRPRPAHPRRRHPPATLPSLHYHHLAAGRPGWPSARRSGRAAPAQRPLPAPLARRAAAARRRRRRGRRPRRRRTHGRTRGRTAHLRRRPRRVWTRRAVAVSRARARARVRRGRRLRRGARAPRSSR